MQNLLKLIFQYVIGEYYYLSRWGITTPYESDEVNGRVIFGKSYATISSSRGISGNAADKSLIYLRVHNVFWRLRKFFKEFVIYVPAASFAGLKSIAASRKNVSRKSFIFVAYFFLIFNSYTTRAQCVSNPPTTGLGPCIDFMAATSSTATSQILKLGYKFHYGKDNYTDYMEKIIYIQSYDCNNSETTGLYARLSLLAHELGHAEYGLREDATSRSAFIKSACNSEGNAVLNNIKVRAETLACSMNSVDIGIIASNPAELLSIYTTKGSGIQSLGQAFCRNNFTSTTKQNYLDYYGGHYDAFYQ